jgi:hypothetical protein
MDLTRIPPAPVGTPERLEWWRGLHDRYVKEAQAICERHAAQTGDEARVLRRQYEQPVFGEIPTWSLFDMMYRCIDTADELLFCTSQAMHSLQIIEAMMADGMASEEFILAAMVHDIGKVALLKGEQPENLFYMNELLATGAPGAGLDQCTLQWNSDDLAWARLKDHLPPDVAWLVRYHSIRVEPCEPYMNASDRDRVQRCLAPFRHYDLYSKAPYFRPRLRLEDFRPIIEKYLPPTLVF